MSFEIEITKSGMWPCVWHWSVWNKPDYTHRSGDTFTKERARKKAIRAKRSMERDDVKTVMEA